jgi:hypothetical protein
LSFAGKTKELVLKGKKVFSRGPFVILKLFKGILVFLLFFKQLNYFVTVKRKKKLWRRGFFDNSFCYAHCDYSITFEVKNS